MQKQLGELGFSQGMMDGPVASLSGGWKMKLALGRAMLYRAQVQLLLAFAVHSMHIFIFVLPKSALAPQ